MDTNIFLNIYVFHHETRQAIYDALDKIKERLWSPHQVMLEFHKNREGHIGKNKRYFQNNFIDDFLKQLTDPYKKIQDLKNKHGKNYSDLGEIIDSFTENAEKEFSESFTKLHESLKAKLIPIEQKLAELQFQLITSKDQDSLYQKLCELYSDDKIGKPFTQSELNELYKEGELRFQHGVPPGYQDKGKTEIYHHRGRVYHSKFGDLILYKQILEHCKVHKIKNVIFISEESAKGDWVDKETKTLRKEIRGEAFEVADIQNFIMMNKDSLLTYSNVEKSPQVQEDFERSDNMHNEWIELETIGKKIIDTIYDKSLPLDSKLIILDELTEGKWSDEAIEWIKMHFQNKIYVLIYEAVVSTLYTDEDSIYISGLESEIERIINDKRIDQYEKRYLINFLSNYIPWLDEGERYRLMREKELSYIKERLFL